MEYVAQLVEPTAEVLDMVAWSLRRLAPGPGNWATQADLENLCAFGFKQEFRTIKHTAEAAKLRVAAALRADVNRMHAQLREARMNTIGSLATLVDTSLVGVLVRNRDDLDAAGCLSKCDKEVSQTSSRHAIKATLAPYNAEERLRHKIKRWKIDGPPTKLVKQISRSISVIGGSCRPCVISGFFRTLWNGWPTSARMRTMAGAQGTQSCVLGCEDAEDRIEHYLLCRKVWELLQRRPPQGMGLDRSRRNIKAMLLADATLTDAERMAIAVSCYAIMRTVHCIKQSRNALKVAPIIGLHITEGMRGSKARGVIFKSLSKTV